MIISELMLYSLLIKTTGPGTQGPERGGGGREKGQLPLQLWINLKLAVTWRIKMS